MTKPYLCSADCHQMEPPDLWTERLPKQFRDRALGFEYVDANRIWKQGDKRLMCEPVTIQGLPNGDPVTHDVDLRLKELEADDIYAETIFPNIGLFCLGFEDNELALATARVYNDWAAETYGPYRDREIAIAPIPVRDIGAAVTEIERVAALGLKGIALPIMPPLPYFLDIYDPIWEAAQSAGLPISFHVGTGSVGSSMENANRATAVLGGGADLGPAAMDAIVTVGPSSFTAVPAENLVGTLVGAGVLARFPDLDVVVVECGAGWLAGLMEALDFAWVPKVGHDREQNRAMSYDEQGNLIDRGFPFKQGGWRHELKPSDYVRRQVKATFMDEPAPLKFREFTGIDSLMWGSDFPHPEGTWPRSREVTDAMFEGVDEDDKAAILGRNLADLYGIELPAPAAV